MCTVSESKTEGFILNSGGEAKCNKPQTWSQCSVLFALEGWVEVLFVRLQKQRRWRWTVGSGSSGGAFWRSPPSLSSPPHQKPLLSTARCTSETDYSRTQATSQTQHLEKQEESQWVRDVCLSLLLFYPRTVLQLLHLKDRLVKQPTQGFQRTLTFQ